MLAQEAVFYFYEKAKGDSTPEVLFCDYEIGESRAVGWRRGAGVADVVDVVLTVCVG